MVHIKGGYYIKARCVKDSAIAHAPPHVREIWDYLLREANHTDRKYSGFIIKRGQLFRSYKDIREALSWQVGWRKVMYNENHMKKGMRFLRRHLMIQLKKELGGMLITVLHYDKYQTQENYEGTKEGTNEGTIEEPTGNQTLPDTNKHSKELKHLKHSNSITPKISNSEIEEKFNSFYSKYPIKKSKQPAFVSFKKIMLKTPEVFPRILEAVEEQIKEKELLKRYGTFCPEWKHPSSWLNQRCWEDEIIQAENTALKTPFVVKV